MLAIGRALMINPRLLILDEATEGLAPLVRAEIYACLAALKRDGQSILVIDKHLAAVTRLKPTVSRCWRRGRIAWQGPVASLAADPVLIARHLHV